jgi:hypothetical protein
MLMLNTVVPFRTTMLAEIGAFAGGGIRACLIGARNVHQFTTRVSDS